jgi:hypothetical protein
VIVELYQAQHYIKDEAANIRKMGLAAPAPRISEALMAIFLVLDDMMETVKKLDDEYNKPAPDWE